MKKLFSSPSKLLKFMLLFSATIVALAVIFVCFFGFNKSYQFGGQYEVSVDFLDYDKADNYIETISDVIKDNNGSVTHSIVGDKTYMYTLSVDFKATSADTENIKQTLIEKFDGEINADQIKINYLSNTFQSKLIFKLLIPTAVVLIALFIYGLIRRNLMYGFALAISFFGTALIGLSLYAITRTQLSVSSLGILGVASILSVVYFVLYTSIAYTMKNSVHGDKENLVDLYVSAISTSRYYAIIPMLVVVAIMVGFIFTFQPTLVQFGISGIVSIFAGIWSSVFLAGSFYFTTNKESAIQIKK